MLKPKHDKLTDKDWAVRLWRDDRDAAIYSDAVNKYVKLVCRGRERAPGRAAGWGEAASSSGVCCELDALKVEEVEESQRRAE